MLVAQADVLEKRIDFSCKNKTLKEALHKIKKKTGLRISYSDKDIEGKHIRSFKQKDQKVRKILSRLLRSKSMTYQISGNRVVVLPAPRIPNTTPKKHLEILITDDKSEEPLPGVTIYIPQFKRQFISTRLGELEREFYAVDSLRLDFLYIGYDSRTLIIPFKRDTSIHVLLAPSNKTLTEIVVTAPQDIPEKDKERVAVITSDQVDMLRSLNNDRDVVKSLHLLPGVQSGNEGFAGLFVRGGGMDQNLILLDNTPVYSATHLMGIFSIFNENVVGDVELHKNSIPAQYGGRLSSVLDIKTRDGDMEEVSVTGSLGLTTSGFTIEGPIKENKTSFILSARRSWLDLLMPSLSKRWLNGSYKINGRQLANEGEARYHFYDLNGKITHRFSDKDRLSISFYNGGDRFKFTDKFETEALDFQSQRSLELSWGNLTTSVQWLHIFNKGISLNTTAGFTDFRFDYFDYNSYVETINTATRAGISSVQNYASDIRDISLQTALNIELSENHLLSIGLQGVRHDFSPGINERREENLDTLIQLKTNFSNPHFQANEFGFFAQSQHNIGKLNLNAGIRTAFFSIDKKLFSTFEPRLSTSLQLTNQYSLRGSYTSSTQFLHLLSNPNLGLPSDLWVPSFEDIPPERSWQLGGGMVWANDTYLFSVDGYYKRMRHLIAINNQDESFLRDNNWRNATVTGNGDAYGAEVALAKKSGSTTGIVGYTLSWSNRQFDVVNRGNAYPYRHDRRHDFSVAIQHDFNKKLAAKADWAYGTGNRFTRPISKIPGYAAYEYESRNRSTMSPFHRLNVGVVIQGERAEKFNWTLDIGVYNVYNRKNPFFTYLVDEDDSTLGNEFNLVELSLFPVLPNINYSFKF